MQLSCSLPPGPGTAELALYAQDLGYDRVWLYDSPTLYWDVWVTLGSLATRTDRIGLGIGVYVPSGDPVLTATRIATTESLAPGRLAVAMATGFTGQLLLGRQRLTWNRVADYVADVRRLLSGESVERAEQDVWLGQPPGWFPPAPIRTPLLLAADGPKGLDVARRLGDGLMVTAPPESSPALDGLDWCAMSIAGTVLEDGEATDSPRVMAAVGASVSMIYRYTYETVGPAAVDTLPNGAAWRAEVERSAPRRRRIEMHALTAIGATERERSLLSPDLVPLTFTGRPADIRHRVRELADRGVSELVYAASGPDVRRELRTMAEAIRGR